MIFSTNRRYSTAVRGLVLVATCSFKNRSARTLRVGADFSAARPGQSLRYRWPHSWGSAGQSGKAVAGHPQGGRTAQCSAARPASRFCVGCGFLRHGAAYHWEDVGTHPGDHHAPLRASRIRPGKSRCRHGGSQACRCDAGELRHHSKQDSAVETIAIESIWCG